MTNYLCSSAVSQIWLSYFNLTLFRKGVINETTYRQMLLRIRNNPKFYL